MKFLLLIFSLSFTLLSAQDMKSIAKEFNLYPGTKASVQWERIFSSQRRLKKYELDKLSLGTLHELKLYLIEHAADSQQPIVPGL